MKKLMTFAFSLLILLTALGNAQAAATSFPFQYRDITNGPLANSYVYKAFVKGHDVYVGIADGLSISTDGGKTYSFATVLSGKNIRSLYVEGNTIYIGTDTDGLYVGTYSKASGFTPRTVNPHLLVGESIRSIYVTDAGKKLYVGTNSGLSISEDSGASFNTIGKKSDDTGLTGDYVDAVYVVPAPNPSDSHVYVISRTGERSTDQRLNVSKDDGKTFAHPTTATTPGLRSDRVFSVYAYDKYLYVGTASGLSISRDHGTSFTTVSPSVSIASVYATHPKYLASKKQGTVGSKVFMGTHGDGLYVGYCTIPDDATVAISCNFPFHMTEDAAQGDLDSNYVTTSFCSR